jgi:hypothetical protein
MMVVGEKKLNLNGQKHFNEELPRFNQLYLRGISLYSLLLFILMMDPSLRPLKDFKNREEFDQALEFVAKEKRVLETNVLNLEKR